MATQIITTYSLIDDILDAHSSLCREQTEPYMGYRSHVYRVFNFARLLIDPPFCDDDKLAIAACFHDLAIFQTFDYLQSSNSYMQTYLRATNRDAWAPEIELMIEMHHKIRRYQGVHAVYVEPFRKADWIDILFGLAHCGIPAHSSRRLKMHFRRERSTPDLS